MLNKNITDCDIKKCYKCGWNEKEYARRKEEINTKGLKQLNHESSKFPIYGIRVNKGRKKQSD